MYSVIEFDDGGGLAVVVLAKWITPRKRKVFLFLELVEAPFIIYVDFYVSIIQEILVYGVILDNDVILIS